MLSELLIGWFDLVDLPIKDWNLADDAYLVGILTCLCTPLFYLIVLLKLFRKNRRQQRLGTLNAAWDPILSTPGAKPIPAYPKIRRADFNLFVTIWLRHYGTANPEDRCSLVKLARTAGVEKLAIDRLKYRQWWNDPVTALDILGIIGEHHAFKIIRPYTHTANPATSFIAARALGRLDTSRALPLILDRLGDGPAWPYNLVGALFQEMDRTTFTRGFTIALKKLVRSGRDAPLTQYLRYADPENIPTVIKLVETSTHRKTWEIEHLKLLTDPATLPVALNGLYSKDDEVCCAALEALQRVGTKQELERVAAALDAPDWSVRCAAGKTLAVLMQEDWQQIRMFARTLDSARAREIIASLGPEIT